MPVIDPRTLEHFPNGTELLKAADKLGLEGVVSKHRDKPYRVPEYTQEYVVERIAA
jgi:ATP-dependent DNA ligase